MYVNADLGESFGVWTMGDDAKVMPLIDIANVACGFHASDPLNITKTIQLAKKHNKRICAHPSYPDLLGFGRRSLKMSADELQASIIYQCGALDAICKSLGVMVEFVKPHGALYNDMMRDETIFITILQALKAYKPKLKLFILDSPKAQRYAQIADKYGIVVMKERFADRGYSDDGSLLPRTDPNALIYDPKMIAQNIQKTDTGADTICIHSDHSPSIKALEICAQIET
jgi:UPF0271 protein